MAPSKAASHLSGSDLEWSPFTNTRPPTKPFNTIGLFWTIVNYPIQCVLTVAGSPLNITFTYKWELVTFRLVEVRHSLTGLPWANTNEQAAPHTTSCTAACHCEATCLRSGGNLVHFAANFVAFLTVKDILRSVNIWQGWSQTRSGTIFTVHSTCI